MNDLYALVVIYLFFGDSDTLSGAINTLRYIRFPSAATSALIDALPPISVGMKMPQLFFQRKVDRRPAMTISQSKK